MVRSMSGHGRGEATTERLRVVAEVRSVNHRFCRISMRLPSELGFFEDAARRLIQARIVRGKVDVALTVEGVSSAPARIDRAAASAWAGELRSLAAELGTVDEVRLQDLLVLPGVVVANGSQRVDAETDAPALANALGLALDSLQTMRIREGEHMAADLQSRVDTMGTAIAAITKAAEKLPRRVRDQLRQRIEDLLEDTGHAVDEDRVLQEAAHYAERADITEEVVRLRSHLEKMRHLLGSDDAVGRTLEFLTQEIHRELSTVGSKTKDLEVADTVVDLKSELERIREQVQNIE